MKKLWSLFLVMFVVLSANLAFAQGAPTLKSAQDIKVDATADVVEINYEDLNRQLNKIDNKLKSGNATKEVMTQDTQFTSQTRALLIDAKKGIEKDMNFIQKRIDALGEGPKEGDKEVGLIAEKRKEFTSELNAQKDKIAEADILLARLDETDIKIFNLRSKALLGNLLDKQPPLINPANLFASSKLFISFLYDIIHSPVDWYEELNLEELAYVHDNLIPVLFIFVLSLWIGVYIRLFIMRKFGYNKEIEHPRYGKKVSAAIFVAIGYGVIPATIIGGLLIWMVSTKIMTIGYFGMVSASFLYYSLYVILGRAISRVVFAPYNERWRLVNVSTEKAFRMTSAFYSAVALIGTFAFLNHVADKSNYSINLSSYIITLSCIIKAFFIVLIVKRFLWDGIEEPDEETENEEDEEGEGKIDRTFRITFLTTLFGIVVCGIAIFGYPFLSSFILNRLIMSFIFVGVLIIIRKAFEEILHRLLLLRFWVKTFKLRRKIISKLNFWLSLVVDPLFALMGIFGILALWGVSTDLLTQTIVKIFTGFTVGGVKISLIAIILGILIFFISISVIKGLKRRLVANVLNKMDIDDGIKHSLEAGFGSIGFVISILLAIVIMGGDLTNFALIAGALSLGVGLGLQNIVNNFVSGIILLFERPIKVGDWVIINGEEGVVQQINIRATELLTWKKASIIIPNATLLSTNITNLTHDDTWGRLDINVGVAYGSDTRRVAEILLECGESQKRVLKKPAPYVIFKNFGESSLDFELRCFTADIMNGLGTSSEIRFEIERRFREEGIDIPFPQRTLHLSNTITRESLNATLETEQTNKEKINSKTIKA